MQINYEAIKALAKAQKQRVTDLIALAPQNDPFYAGTPNDRLIAEWFADLWQRFGYGTGVHIRRVHYQIISQDPPVLLPNGKPYENTEACWDILSQASKMARYLELVDPAAFVDRRNPEPKIYTTEQPESPQIDIEANLWDSDTELPDFPDLPDYHLKNYKAQQPYHLEIWCEKSTQNDILIPLAQHYHINLVTGVGELSVTATLAAVRRFEVSGKPARILYVSDFDPAGLCMPVSVARKIEYFIRNERLDLDVRLFPVVLTTEQVQAYQLPRTPIKDTERRRDSFEERHGTGATELDALEALYPGELRRLLRTMIERYYDTSLDSRVMDAKSEAYDDLEAIRQSVLDRHQAEIDALQDEYEQLRRDFEARMTGYRTRLTSVWQAISDDLANHMPDSEAYPLPSARLADEIGDGLYNSQRDYIEQIATYKEHQGKAA